MLYSSIDSGGTEGLGWLHLAVETFVYALAEEATPEILWTLEYMQPSPAESSPNPSSDAADNIIVFAESNVDLAFDDAILREVRSAWQKITGETDGFMAFEDREVGAYDDEED